MLSEAASLATSTALTDELVSHGELMSTLLFVEILRARNVQAEWFDVRKVMRTDDHFGRAVPDSAALSELARAQLQPRLQEALVVTRALSAASRRPYYHARPRRQRLYRRAARRGARRWPGGYLDRRAGHLHHRSARGAGGKRIDKIGFEEAAEMATFGAKVLHPATLLPAVRSDIPVLSARARIRRPAARWCATPPKIRRCSARWRCAASKRC